MCRIERIALKVFFSSFRACVYSVQVLANITDNILVYRIGAKYTVIILYTDLSDLQSVK